MTPRHRPGAIRSARSRCQADRRPSSNRRKAARSAQAQGLAALHERDVRRRGLLISIAAILLTIAGLYLTIRMIERK